MAVFTDDFTGAEDQALEARTGWTKVDAGLSMAFINASNQIKFASGADISYTAPDTGSADHYAECDLLSGAVGKGFFPLCVRVTDINNFIGIRLFGGDCELFVRNGGSFTFLGEATGAADTYRIEASGNDIEVFKGGVSLLTASTALHNTVQTPGTVRRANDGDPVLDNWESDALGGGGATIDLLTGAFNFSAPSPALTQAYALGAGTDAAAGQAFTLAQGVGLGAGSDATSGQPVGMAQRYNMGAGSDSTSGQAVSVVYGFLYALGAGVVNIVGLAIDATGAVTSATRRGLFRLRRWLNPF